MGLKSFLLKRLLGSELTKLQREEVARSLGSEFYSEFLKYVKGNPVYIDANTSAYINDGYLFNPTVYSIVSFIAQKASQPTWGVYEVKDEKALQRYKASSPDLAQFKKSAIKTKAMIELPDHELNELFSHPNSIQPWAEFIEQVIGFKLVTGNSYIHCIGPKNGANAGMIKEMWALPSQVVSIVAGDRFQPVRAYEMTGDRTVTIPPEEVIHLKYWTPEYMNGAFLYGLSPIRAGRRVVTKSNSSFDSMVASFQNMGAVGILSPTKDTESLTEEQQEMLEQRFKKKTGAKNAGKPLISSVPLLWQQTGMSPVDLAIIESDKMDLRTLCNIFHVPSELFNDAANKTYANTKEAGSAVYTNAVIPALNQFRDALNHFLFPRYESSIYIDYDTSMISELQDDISMMTTALQGTWWLTPNEKRVMMSIAEDEANPMMNEYFVPMGVTPMGGMTFDASDEVIEEEMKRMKIFDYGTKSR